MFIQKIATILMDDEIHDILNEGNEYGFQEYIFISEPSDVEKMLNKLIELKNELFSEGLDNFYLTETVKEIKEALKLLDKEVQNIVFVYQN